MSGRGKGMNQPYCVPFPNTKVVGESFLVAAGCQEFLGGFNPKKDCVTNLHELTCATTFSMHDTITVCDGSTINFSRRREAATSIQVGLNLVGADKDRMGKDIMIFQDGNKIIKCGGCDCTFTRNVKDDVCPFFTTSRMDSKLELKGIKFMSHDSAGRCARDDGEVDRPRGDEDSSFDMDGGTRRNKDRCRFPAEQNIIALSNMPRVMAAPDEIGEVPYDLKLKTDLKESKLPKECKPDKRKKKPKRHLDEYDFLRASHHDTDGKRNLKGDDEEDSFFCDDLFFDDEETVSKFINADLPPEDVIKPLRMMCYSVASTPEVLEEPFELNITDISEMGYDMPADQTSATWTLFSYHFDADGDGIVTNEDILAGCLTI